MNMSFAHYNSNNSKQIGKKIKNKKKKEVFLNYI